MQPGKTLRARLGWSLVAVLLLACLFASPPALAEISRSGAGDLSQRLAELAKPSVRELPESRQARLLSLAPSGPGSLLRDGNRVLVDVRFDHGAAVSAAALRAAGGEVVNVSRRYQTVTVAARPAGLRALAAVKGVQGVSEILTPISSAAGCSGITTSEGDAQLLANQARADFNLDGRGVTMGILSDSFDQAEVAVNGSEPVATHAAEDVANGDLPGPGNPCGHATPVNVLENDSQGGEELPTDEGRAMAQIVHDLAPGASLDFASASNGEFAFVKNIERLAQPLPEGAGAQVIADDVVYLDEPFFQDGPVAVAADRTASKGATYFSAAGNDNLLDAGGHEIGSWEAPEYRDAGECPPAVAALSEQVEAEEQKFIEEEELSGVEPQGLRPSHCMNFKPEGPEDKTFGISVPAGGRLSVDLQWAEPWFGVETDLDAFLLDQEGNIVEAEVEGQNFPVGSTEDNVSRSLKPFEYFHWKNPGPEQEVQLVINKFSGLGARLKIALIDSKVTSTEYPEPGGSDIVGPTIFGHTAASGVISVGAVPFFDSSTPEEYSSRGPAMHYFGPVTSVAPATSLKPPRIISKPDIAATDCGVTTFFAVKDEAGNWRFCGTSAAAPHAAAVAALMRQANPALSPAQVRAVLTGTARTVGNYGADAVGSGLIDAFSAVAAVAPPPTITITERPAAVTKDRIPRIGFTANRPVAFACSLDGGAFEPCTSPFVPLAPLADGQHGVAVRGIDVVGMTGMSETVPFTVDTTAPRTFFRKHPRKVIRTHHRKVKVAFRFGSNEEGVTFTCRVDGGLQRICPENFVRRFRIGLHSVRVLARDTAGNVDATPAVYRFRVKRIG
jgi:subtilisin family serine protease